MGQRETVAAATAQFLRPGSHAGLTVLGSARTPSTTFLKVNTAVSAQSRTRRNVAMQSGPSSTPVDVSASSRYVTYIRGAAVLTFACVDRFHQNAQQGQGIRAPVQVRLHFTHLSHHTKQSELQVQE